MTALNKILLPDENLLFQTQKSLIIFTYPVIWTVVTAILLWLKVPILVGFTLPLVGQVTNFAWVVALVALGSWLNQYLLYQSAIFMVTNRRVIMREGVFLKHSAETRLSAIAEIRIDQPLVGQWLDFGNIRINSFGGGSDIFAQIAAPTQFQRSASEALDKLSKNS